MKQILLFPFSKSGKILKGFYPTVIEHLSDVPRTLLGFVRFSQKFGIKYYSFDGVVKPLL